MKTAAEEEVHRAANMTINRHVEFQVHLSDTETEATTSSIADTNHVVKQLQRDL